MQRIKSDVCLTMTIREVYYAMRNAGIRCSTRSISDGIASGAYPFGRIVFEGETGRRTFEIFRVDFYAWLETRIPKGHAYDGLRLIPQNPTKEMNQPHEQGYRATL